MASWIKNMKDGSKRLKDEIVRTIGVGGDDCMDPVLEYRCQRFNKYNENLNKLSQAMTHYLETSQAHTQASVQLMHSFSAFFEAQIQDATPEDKDYAQTKALAQGALRLEEIHQSLRTNVMDAAHHMQVEQVARSIQHVRKSNASLQKQLTGLKQRLADYDSMRRSAESQRKNTPEYERAAQRMAAAEATLATLTNDLNTELHAFESRRSVDMKNELLTVAACELFVHTRAHQHYEQLVPLLPGMARPLLQVVEYACGRPRTNPAENDTVGVVHYAGAPSRGVMETPLQYHHKLAPVDAASVHPLQSTKFADIHPAEKLAMAAYSRRQCSPSSCEQQRTRQQEAKMNGTTWTRGIRALNVRNARSMGSGKAYVAMPETAMITNNGTHVFERKGWEYSAYLGMLGGPIVLYLGLSNVPETDSEVFARAEAYAARKGDGHESTVVKRPSGGPISSQYTYERSEIGERPSLQA